MEVLIDPSDLEQEYIGDCQVCCKPINFLIFDTANDELAVRAYADDNGF
jgi:hypothetical protein